jgi:TP53 regulating kinase-like protein
MEKIIAQGAEAIIYKIDNKIVKDRIPKKYRIPEIDNKIRKARTKSEAKIIKKLQEIINVPKILADPGVERMIHMEFIKGEKLSKNLEKLDWKKICKELAESIAKMHDFGIIHGDLTTSNMIYTKENKLYFIDFGLGFHSIKIEDKAVDLHLLRQALEAKHHTIWQKAYEIILKNYNPEKKDLIIKRISEIEKRGRYRH